MDKILDYYQYKNRSILNLGKKRSSARELILDKLNSKYYKQVHTDCPLCSESKNEPIAHRDLYGFPVSSVICNSCDLLYTNPRLSDDSLNSFYNEHYRNLDRPDDSTLEDYFQLQRKKGENLYRFLNENIDLNQFKGKTILEVGCGAGGILQYFKEKGFDVMGCDIGKYYLNYGVREKNLNLIEGNIEDIYQNHEHQFDNIGLIIYEQVLEHLPSPNAEMSKLLEIATPGTILYIGVPGLRNIHQAYKGNFIHFLQIPHLLHFTKFHLQKVLVSIGFESIYANEKIQSIFRIPNSSEKPVFNAEYYQEKNKEYIQRLESIRKMDHLKNWPYLTIKKLYRYIRGKS